MNAITDEPASGTAKRPALVWVISIFYLLSAGYVVLSFVLIHSGAVPINAAQNKYFQSQTIWDYGSSLIIGLANLAGAVLLLALRKPAFHLFAFTFVVGLALTVYQMIMKGWLGAIGGAGLVGAIIGWGISVAVIIYTRRLTDRGILR